MKIWRALPSCSGRWDRYVDGTEFNCGADLEIECEECLSLYHHFGGRKDPTTGRAVPKIICLLRYGKSKMTIRKENERIDTM